MNVIPVEHIPHIRFALKVSAESFKKVTRLDDFNTGKTHELNIEGPFEDSYGEYYFVNGEIIYTTD